MAERKAGLLGKLPATDYGDKNVNLDAVLAAPLPAPPKSFGHGTMFRDWGMLGNDEVGDCAEACACHSEMLWTGIGNHGENAAKFTKDNAISAYSAVAGYVPGDPATDVGTRYDLLFDYWRSTGIPDADGKRHKIDLAVRLPIDWDTFIRAVYAFKVVAVGTLIPASAMQQFEQHKPWTIVPGSPDEGGHAVPGAGSHNSDNQVTVLTWGLPQVMMRDFFEEKVDELWIPLSREALKPIESALHVVDWSKVESIAQSL